MKKLMLWMVAVAMLAGCGLHAQDITGTWQGTLPIPTKPLRLVIKIAKTDKGLSTTLYSIDQGGQALHGTAALQGGTVKIDIETIGGSYAAKLSADGKSMDGQWTQGSKPLPLSLAHVTDATAWEIPAFVPQKLMAADADPAFDVATIKPNDSNATNMQQLTINGRNFKVRAGSLNDLMEFAYGVQIKQLVGMPDWASSSRYDIDAVPDQEGEPSMQQLKGMIQKLLVERFALKFHHEKRELSAFVLTVSKTGQKLTPTQVSGPLPGLGFQPGAAGLTLRAVNANMTVFAGFLQGLVLDRPVVDQTALTGNYDFHVTFMPDETEFNGHPPKLPQTDGADASSSPDLFEAMQEQLGLKLTAEKTPVDVIVIDHVEKPSAN